MPGGGLLTIETAVVQVVRRDFPPGTTAEPGPFVILRVRDTGIGMEEETIQRIFDPFFTTKEKGRGTGLGLSTVYGIVSRSNGFIKVVSEPGKGAEFTIYLALHSAGLSAVEVGAAPGDTLRAVTGTVLVVEDQDIVREFVVESLRRSGHTVLEARSGAEALQLIAENDDRVQLIVSDVMMPGMGGRELAARARTLHSSIRVLFMTGYADGTFGTDTPEGRDEVIMKPFAPEELEARVVTLLRSAATGIGSRHR
jgi:CheY-like chemotaxis protein